MLAHRDLHCYLLAKENILRYFVITYVRRPNGQLDEQNQVTRSLKNRDLQMASVILDFKKLEVVKASFNGVNVPRDFNRIVEYYYQHYKNVLDRLFAENGWEIEAVENKDAEPATEANPS